MTRPYLKDRYLTSCGRNSGLADKDGTDAARRQLAERFGIPLTGSGSQPKSPSSSPSWPWRASYLTGSQYVIDGGGLPTV